MTIVSFGFGETKKLVNKKTTYIIQPNVIRLIDYTATIIDKVDCVRINNDVYLLYTCMSCHVIADNWLSRDLNIQPKRIYVPNQLLFNHSNNLIK